jgi:hypothetical protein
VTDRVRGQIRIILWPARVRKFYHKPSRPVKAGRFGGSLPR